MCAQNLPGTQQLRQLMGHRQFGARVVYGDCLFFTISPDEQHSALVLRLSRFRKNDPFVRYGTPERQKLSTKDYPKLDQADEDIVLDLYGIDRDAFN